MMGSWKLLEDVGSRFSRREHSQENPTSEFALRLARKLLCGSGSCCGIQNFARGFANGLFSVYFFCGGKWIGYESFLI